MSVCGVYQVKLEIHFFQTQYKLPDLTSLTYFTNLAIIEKMQQKIVEVVYTWCIYVDEQHKSNISWIKRKPLQMYLFQFAFCETVTWLTFYLNFWNSMQVCGCWKKKKACFTYLSLTKEYFGTPGPTVKFYRNIFSNFGISSVAE